MNKIKYSPYKTLRLSAEDPQHLLLAVNILQGNGLVALPTETVYGLAANGYSPEAIERVFLAKKRPSNNPLILHVNSPEKALKLFDFANDKRGMERFYRLSAAFWPGPLTIIAKKTKVVPKLATSQLPTVAVRIPKTSATLRILEMLDFPLVMPSANLSTRPSPTRAEHVLRTLDGHIDAIVAGPDSEIGIESTVISIDGEKPQILRPGMLRADSLSACLSEDVCFADTADGKGPSCPGQRFLHYSPAVAAIKICAAEDMTKNLSDADVVIVTEKDAKARDLGGHTAAFVLMSDQPQEYARQLYGVLYDCERDPKTRLLLIIPSGNRHEWLPILDRILRSAGHHL